MEIIETIDTLEELREERNLSDNEDSAINEALCVLRRLKRNEEDGVDFQGWPIEKLTMKDLRQFVNDNESLDDDVKLRVFQDDGMGYGAVNGYCSSLCTFEDDKKKEVQIWF